MNTATYPYAFNLQVSPEEEQIEGNASAIDAETDKEIADEIRRQLDNGNEWAWCTVTVKCTHTASGIYGLAHLGCCSYKSEDDFKADGYYKDMCAEALEECDRAVAAMRKALEDDSI